MARLLLLLRFRPVLLPLVLVATVLWWTGWWRPLLELELRGWDVLLAGLTVPIGLTVLGLVVLVGGGVVGLVRALLGAQWLRSLPGLILLLSLGGMIAAWLFAPGWLIEQARSLLPEWVAERAPSYAPGWSTKFALVLVGLLVVAARRFGVIWIISSLVAAAAIAAWGIQGALRDDYFALTTAGVALPILVVYFFFKWTAPMEPQRQANVHTREGAAKTLDFHTEPAQRHAKKFWSYAVLSQASYLPKEEAEQYVEEQHRQPDAKQPPGAGGGQAASTPQPPQQHKKPPWQLLHERTLSQGTAAGACENQTTEGNEDQRTEADAVKGLHYQIWFHEQDHIFAVAFRGTRFTRPSDWNANLHWVLGFRDHYTDIEAFIARLIRDVIEGAAKAMNLSDYKLVCAGHSLGGGLARQLAFCYPGRKCTEIEVYGFDSSAVDGRLWLKDRPRLQLNRQKLTISEVYERGEVLSLLRIALAYVLPRPDLLNKLRQRTTYYRFNYSVSANVLQSHNMEELAAALKAIAGSSEPADVEPGAARLQLQLIYDYIKFHIALYMATPVLLMVFAYGFQVQDEEPFRVGLVMMVLIFALAGMHASYFMGTHVNRQWQTDHLEEFQRSAFSTRRRFLHHWMYWAGLLAGVAGLVLAVVYPGPKS